MEREPDGFVHREWLLLDWDAGDRSSTVEVLLVHDPPRWLPGDDRSDATLLTTDEGQISRSGPDVLVQSSESGDDVLLACLPIISFAEPRRPTPSSQPDVTRHELH